MIYMRHPPGYEQGNKAENESTKSLLIKEFGIMKLGKAKKILGMEIVRDQSRKIMRVSQFGYVFKVLYNFRIENEKSVQMPLSGHFKLSLKDCSVRDCDVERTMFRERTKRINIRFHFVREVMEAKTVEVVKVGTKHNVTDALTKVVPGSKFKQCLKLLSIGTDKKLESFNLQKHGKSALLMAPQQSAVGSGRGLTPCATAG
nr:hypothetical protein [Tanacetum cinerariifolium]